MERLRNYVLPVAIVLGVLLHNWCGYASFLTPYLIYVILLLAFCPVDIRKLRPEPIHFWLIVYQVVASGAIYLLLRTFGADEIIAEGLLVGVLCPVAASSVVIACILGANRATMTSFSIISNLATVIVAPIYFSFIGNQQSMPFFESFWLILQHVFSALGLPLLTALVLQMWFPKLNEGICKFKSWSFYVWAVLFTITFGQTVHFITLEGRSHVSSMIWLAVASVIGVVVQFGTGRLIGKKYNVPIAGQQMMGQKNTALGIWMSNLYLHPLAAVYLALYSVTQNLFNTLQMWIAGKKGVKET